MKICFIADLRSSIARGWIQYFVGRHEVHVLSTLPAPPLPGARLYSLAEGSPDAERWRRKKADWSRFLDPISWQGRVIGNLHDLVLQPLKAETLAARAAEVIERVGPDLVHSLRIPIEGEIGGMAAGNRPHLISAWGNDFTLYADRSWFHRRATRRALAACSGFLADAWADIGRAAEMGLPEAVPRLVVPGAGGIQRGIFPGADASSWAWRGDLEPLASLDPHVPVIVNPRGFRRYVRNDTFFAAIRLIALGQPEARFVGVGMNGWRPIENLVHRYRLADRVLLTGPLEQPVLAALYRRASVMVSPTEHDGTPNSLLESMACGCFPVCGDLPSIREWIVDGRNGLLVRADRPLQLAAAIRRALAAPGLRAEAARINRELVAERADYRTSMAAAEELYARVAGTAHPGAGRHRRTVRPEEVFS